MLSYIGFWDIAIAALLAAVLTMITLRIMKAVSKLKKTALNDLADDYEIKKILQKCYTMFPMEKLLYNGLTITRGTRIRITTVQHKIIEGVFIGTNKQEILCIQTNRHIVAHGIDGITEITQIEE